MVYSFAKIIHWVFLLYTILLFTRIVGSWFHRFTYHPVMHFARTSTDPYLNIFRRLIPPIGGALDLSPILGFFVLEVLERIIMGIIVSFA